MSPISVALAAAAVVTVVGWLVLVTARRILSRTGRQSTAAGQPSVLEANGGREDWIYGDRASAERAGRTRAPSEAEALSDDAKREAAEILARARSEGEAIQDSARGEAEAIVQAAELKAGEALVEVERARGRLEREVQRVAREQALMTAKQKKLSDLLLTALEEIERASANGSRDLGGLQEELRATLRGTGQPIDEGTSPKLDPAQEAGSPGEPSG